VVLVLSDFDTLLIRRAPLYHPPERLLVDALFIASGAMLFFLLGYRSKGAEKLAQSLPALPSAWNSNRGLAVGGFFLILAFIGLMLLVREGGGLLASREYYFSHARDVELPKIEEYGTLLWRIFYPFGAWFLLASCLTEPRQDVRRIEGVLFFATVVVG